MESQALNAEDTERGGKPSASSFAILVNCPGSHNLVQTVPTDQREDSTEYSERGERIHKARETRSTAMLQDDSEVAAYNQGIANEALVLEQWKHEFGIGEVDEYLEDRLWLRDGMSPIASGKLDVTFVERGDRTPHIVTVDWKTLSGLSAGPAVDSWQLRLQAILAAQEFNAVHVRCVFNKPEAYYRQTDAVDFDSTALRNTEYMARYHLWLATLPDAPRRAGAWCWFCPAQAFCPEAASFAMLPSVIAGGALAKVDTLSPQDLRKLWGVDSDIRKIQDRVSARLATFTDEGLSAIGLRRGKAKETDKFVDVNGAVTALYEAGLTKSDLIGCMTVGKGKLVELIRREFALSEAAAEKWLAEKCGTFMEVKQGARPIVEIRK
jgi:hypothetical protein